MCVNVDSMGGFNHCVFFPMIFIMEQQREDVGGFRLQCFKRRFEKGLVI